jgi:hypothetical protein
MSKTIGSLLEKVLWPLLLLALTPTFTLVGSKLQSGDWLTWLKLIPSWAYWSFFGVIFFLLLVGSIVRRIRHLQEHNLPSLPLFFSIPRWGYWTVGTLTYQDVLWRVRIPAPRPWEGLSREEARSARVNVEIPPRCPKCDTELEEAETFFGNYRWSCLRCGFARKNSMSYYRESIRAEKLAQSWWEKEPKDN